MHMELNNGNLVISIRPSGHSVIDVVRLAMEAGLGDLQVRQFPQEENRSVVGEIIIPVPDGDPTDSLPALVSLVATLQGDTAGDIIEGWRRRHETFEAAVNDIGAGPFARVR